MRWISNPLSLYKRSCQNYGNAIMERRKPRFSAVKLVADIISTRVTIWLVFSVKVFTSLMIRETASLFGYILSLGAA